MSLQFFEQRGFATDLLKFILSERVEVFFMLVAKASKVARAHKLALFFEDMAVKSDCFLLPDPPHPAYPHAICTCPSSSLFKHKFNVSFVVYPV